MALFNIKKIIKHCFENLILANKLDLRFPKKINKKVKNHKNKVKKGIFIPKITNSLDFSSQKSKKNSVIFFSDFSHGITLLPFDESFCWLWFIKTRPGNLVIPNPFESFLSQSFDYFRPRVIPCEKSEKNMTDFFFVFLTWKVKSISYFSNKNTCLDIFWWILTLFWFFLKKYPILFSLMLMIFFIFFLY